MSDTSELLADYGRLQKRMEAYRCDRERMRNLVFRLTGILSAFVHHIPEAQRAHVLGEAQQAYQQAKALEERKP